MSSNILRTPWGRSRDIKELVEGVWRISTAGHGELKLGQEQWEELPAVVRDTMLNPTFAEEDCEEPIAPDPAGPGGRQGARTGTEDCGPLPLLRSGPALPRQRRRVAMTATRRRPRCLPSVTTKLSTELGSLFITVGLDQDGQPFEVFGSLGKTGSLQHGMTELACRLISLHLRRGTPLDEIINQIQGISEMQPWPNLMDDGAIIYVQGLGDAIALALKEYLRIETAQPTATPPPSHDIQDTP